MPKTPQHLTLSVSPKGRVHFVRVGFEFTPIGSCARVPALTPCCDQPWIAFVDTVEDYNRFPRPVTCKRCLAEMEKRGWSDG